LPGASSTLMQRMPPALPAARPRGALITTHFAGVPSLRRPGISVRFAAVAFFTDDGVEALSARSAE
jgi:hypothetical protein